MSEETDDTTHEQPTGWFDGPGGSRRATFTAYAKMLAERDTHSAALDEINPHFRSKYATLASVLKAGLSHAARHEFGLVFLPSPGVMRAALVHQSGGAFVASYPVLCKDPKDPQKMKAATTYAKRVLAEGLLCLATEDDDGNAAAEAPPQKAQTPRPAPPPRPAPAPAPTPTPPRDEKREMWEEVQRIRKRFGEGWFRDVVGPEDPASMDALRETHKRVVAAASEHDGKGLEVVQEARQPWKKYQKAHEKV